MCSGASGVEVAPETEDELRFGEALDALLRQLALRSSATARARGGSAASSSRGGDGEAVERAARAVANSPLVKTALHGGDPNWGRIAQAVGGALLDTAPLALDIAIEGVQVCAARRGVRARRGGARAARRARRGRVRRSACPGEGAETEVFFSDLGHEYVTINAEYTT